MENTRGIGKKIRRMMLDRERVREIKEKEGEKEREKLQKKR
jgi:hypothetical protein